MKALEAIGFAALVCALIYTALYMHRLDKEWTARVLIEQMKKDKEGE